MERTITLAATLIVLGGTLGIPSVLLQFPANLMMLALPLLCVEFIHKIEKQSGSLFVIHNRLLFCASIWIGYAIAFHLKYGEWDYQGVWIGVVASPISLGLLYLRSYVSRSIPESGY